MRRVVVTGMGAVTPIGVGVPAFFDGLRSARAGVDVISRFEAAAFPTRVAAEVRGLKGEGLELPPQERAALLGDPKSLYGLVAGREALRQAFGEAPPTEWYRPRRLSAFIAAGLEICHLEQVAAHLRPEGIDGASFLAAAREAPALAHLQTPSDLGARCLAREARVGGLFCVDVSACAAGTQALGEAFRAIRDGVADAAIAGGYDSMVNPLGVGGFCMLGAMTTSNELRGGASRPFDARRDGFVLGEGAGMCVLEELEGARQRGAKILGEVLGYASSLDAYRVSDPHPEQEGAIRAMRAALKDAAVDQDSVDYVNAHGTGTLKNDPAETRAIRAVFPNADRIPVSSTKSQIGHLIGAAGAVEFLACLFAVQEGLLPATINLKERDPECDLDYVPNQPRAAKVRTFVSNSFGFGGQNAVIVGGALQEG